MWKKHADELSASGLVERDKIQGKMSQQQCRSKPCKTRSTSLNTKKEKSSAWLGITSKKSPAQKTADGPCASGPGLLRNGNFERGPLPSQLRNTTVKDPHAIPEWEISGYVEYIESGRKQRDMLLVVPEGSFAVRLGNEASIKQRIKTIYSSKGWDSYAWSFMAEFEDVELLFHNTGSSDDAACGLVIDCVAMKTLNLPKRTNKNLLKNGDFEEGPYIIPNTTIGVLIPNGHGSALPGWIVESAKPIKYLDSAHYWVPSGKYAVELVAGMESAVAQVVKTVPGRVYALAFLVGDGNNACEGTMLVDAHAGVEKLRVVHESTGKGGSKRAELRFTSTAERTRIMFRSLSYNTRSDDLSSLCGPVIDDVTLLSVRVTHRLSF
ncbi:hypothetical protein J5N97_006290 [Dioscorea zingiberensis]|uniref:DUF642 domain-containing protein n=1 Tax=Dioscorea zingiberensis TaxID=325984 RepID=A0A9D5HT77_9LILI|nr:hypothetical protein J5N97_006290 [Dioscorea zingiberensis]